MAEMIILDSAKEVTQEEVKKASILSWDWMAKLNNISIGWWKMTVKNKVIFYRLLSTMLNSWISIIKAVSILELQEKDAWVKKILGIFVKEMKAWKKMSDCMFMYPDSFAEWERWIAEFWEKTWKLNTALVSLADQIERVDSIQKKIKWAMTYPVTVIWVIIWVVAVMMIKIVPTLLELFDDKSKLPKSTLALMATSDFFTKYWFHMIIVWIVSFVLLKAWTKTTSWAYKFDKIMLRAPIVWNLYRKMILSKFARTLSWMMSSWISILEALRIVASSVWSEVYKQRVMMMREDVKAWLKIYESLEWDPLFPTMMLQMIQVWEQAAQLDKTILKVADFYDEELNEWVENINKMIEPIIVVTMAVLIWWIAWAIMEPIMWLADQVSSG